MHDESILILVALVLTLVLNAASIVVLRSVATRMVESALAYRAPSGRSQKSAKEGEEQDQYAYSPLKDVFQQYSVLTARMADLVFRLTELRSHDPEEMLAAARELQTEVASAMSGMQPGARQSSAHASGEDAP